MRSTPLCHNTWRIRQFFWRRILALFLSFTFLTSPSPLWGEGRDEGVRGSSTLRQPQATETDRETSQEDVLDKLRELLRVAQKMVVPVSGVAPETSVEGISLEPGAWSLESSLAPAAGLEDEGEEYLDPFADDPTKYPEDPDIQRVLGDMLFSAIAYQADRVNVRFEVNPSEDPEISDESYLVADLFSGPPGSEDLRDDLGQFGVLSSREFYDNFVLRLKLLAEMGQVEAQHFDTLRGEVRLHVLGKPIDVAVTVTGRGHNAELITLHLDFPEGRPERPEGFDPAAGLEEHFVSQDAQRSTALRNALWNQPQALEVRQPFVAGVLRPFEISPAPPEGLLRPGVVYKTSTASMDESKVEVLRSMAEDLISRSTQDPEIRTAATGVVELFLSRLDQGVVPGRPLRGMSDNEAVEMMLELIRVATGVNHPYETFNRQVNEQTLSQLEVMERVVRESDDPLGTAISMGIIGNALDFADQAQRQRLAKGGFDVSDEIRRAPTLAYVVDQRADLIQTFQREEPGRLLFLTDNAGEIVFDLPLLKLLLEQGWRITIAGKSLPHVNDMTVDELRGLFRDARVIRYLGAEQISERIRIIGSGTAMTGFDMRRATPEMVEEWLRAEIVYTKGQGMIETLRYAAHTRVIFQAVLVKQPAYFNERDDNGRPLTLKRGDPLFLKTGTAAGLEDGSSAEKPTESAQASRGFETAEVGKETSQGVLERFQAALQEMGIAVQWHPEIREDPALWRQVERGLPQILEEPGLLQRVAQEKGKLRLDLGWGLELRGRDTEATELEILPKEAGWVEPEGEYVELADRLRGAARRVGAAQLFIQPDSVSYQRASYLPALSRLEGFSLPGALRDFLVDRNLTLVMKIPHADEDGWKGLQWLLDPKTLLRNVPAEIESTVLQSPIPLLEGPAGRKLAPLIGYTIQTWTDPALRRLVPTEFLVRSWVFHQAVVPIEDGRYRLDLRMFSEQHPVRRFMDFLAHHRIRHIGLHGGPLLALLAHRQPKDLDVVQVLPSGESFRAEGDREFFTQGYQPLAAALGRDVLALFSSTANQAGGPAQFDGLDVDAFLVAVDERTGLRSNEGSLLLSVDRIVVLPMMDQLLGPGFHVTTALVLDPHGALLDLEAERARLVGSSVALSFQETSKDLVFRTIRRMVREGLEFDLESRPEDVGSVGLLRQAVKSWEISEDPKEAQRVRADFERRLSELFRTTDPFQYRALELLEEFGVDNFLGRLGLNAPSVLTKVMDRMRRLAPSYPAIRHILILGSDDPKVNDDVDGSLRVRDFLRPLYSDLPFRERIFPNLSPEQKAGRYPFFLGRVSGKFSDLHGFLNVNRPFQMIFVSAGFFAENQEFIRESLKGTPSQAAALVPFEEKPHTQAEFLEKIEKVLSEAKGFAGLEQRIPLPAAGAAKSLVILTPETVEAGLETLQVLEPAPGETLQLAVIVEDAAQQASVEAGLEQSGLTLALPILRLDLTGFSLAEAIVDIQIRAWTKQIETFVVQTLAQFRELGRFLKIPGVSLRAWYEWLDRKLGLHA